MLDEAFYCLHSDICKTLANAKRQMILGCLRDDELTVGDIQRQTGIPQATLSQHLALLRTHGVVRARRDGTHMYYSITNHKIIQAFDLITEVMQDILGEQKETADAAVGSGTA